MNTFLPENFKVEKKPTDYLKFEEGETTFRILSPSINGHQGWKNKKPVTKPHGSEWSTEEVDDMGDTKQFIACVVYNYQYKKIQVWMLTQKGMIQTLMNLARGTKWGDPKNYDITVTREGTTMNDTKYTLMPEPKEPISKEVEALYKKTPVNLNALYINKDPFKDLEEVDINSYGT